MRAFARSMVIDYEQAGSGDTAILFLPALGARSTIWQPQIERFHQDYLLICPETGGNFPGVFASPPMLRDYADAALAVLDAVGILQAHIVGISMGGMIAQQLVLSAPDRVSSLVLASTTSMYPPQARQQLAHRAEVARSEGMRALVEPTLDRWFTPEFARRHPDQVDHVRRMLAEANPEAYAAAALAVSMVDTLDRLTSISAPTLVLEAEYDQSMPPAAAKTLAEKITAARLELIPDAAHLSNVGNAPVFNRLVGEFLREVALTDQDSGAASIIAPW